MNDEAEVAEFAEILRERDKQPPEYRRIFEAERILGGIVPHLPDGETLLTEPQALDAWRTLLELGADSFPAYMETVRRRCGPRVAEFVQRRIGPPLALRGKRPIHMLSLSELAARTPMVDRIRGVFPERGTAAIIGAAGSGKTFAGHDAIFAIARAEPWHNRRCKYAPCVIVQAEGSGTLRTRAYAKHHGITLEDLPIRIVEQALDLRSPGADLDPLLDAIASVQSEIGAVRVVLIDTLARTFGSGSDNDPADMGQYIAAIGRISEAIDGLVIVIHHCGKDASRGSRGHSSFPAALDAELEITRNTDGTRTARLSKLRDGTDGDEFSFRLEVVDLGPNPDPDADPGERITSCVCVPCGAPAAAPRRPKGRNQVRAYDTIVGALGTGQALLHAEAVRLVQTACEMARPRAWEAVDGLIEGGFIVKGPMGPLELPK